MTCFMNKYLLLYIFLFLWASYGLQAQIPGENPCSAVKIPAPAVDQPVADHECRLWGILTSGNVSNGVYGPHLQAFRDLSASNPDGWGLGFYTLTLKGGLIPVIYRGMWRADEDFMYDSCAEVLLENLSVSGIGHVRNTSSGYEHIPDPHPFLTYSVNRNFSMMFAHNGTLNKPTLINLLGDYPQLNHYHYGGENINDPNHDSDLYRLFLMKWIDEHPFTHITPCLKDAMVYLTGQMGENLSYNFIMTSAMDTMWALRYNNTLTYRREPAGEGYTWEVASEPLSEEGWISATNRYLYVFTSSKPVPDSILIRESEYGMPDESGIPVSFDFSFQNPMITSDLNLTFFSAQPGVVSLQIFSPNGQIINDIRAIMLEKGINPISVGLKGCKSGMYYVRVTEGTRTLTKKLVMAF